MNAKDFDQGENLKASDLSDTPIKGLITAVDAVTLDGVRKLRIQVSGIAEKIVLNKTRLVSICGAYGDETDNWLNKPVMVSKGVTQFKGRPEACICISVPRKGGKTPAKQPASESSSDEWNEDRF